LLRGQVGLAEFSLTAVKNDEVCKLARRVAVKPIQATRYGPVSLRISFRSGETLERTVEVMKGEPANPLSDTELSNKVQACIRYGEFPKRTFDDLQAWIADLENDPNPLPKLHTIIQARGVA
jgi:2-methylcitrate dehydratase PrpD